MGNDKLKSKELSGPRYVRKVIAPQPEEFAREGGFMELAETVQLIGSAQATCETRGKLKAISNVIQIELLDLAQISFRRRWGEEAFIARYNTDMS